MVDTKFLIVTTLCYVGIFVVVLVVCCCAWARYIRNEGRMPPRRNKPSSRGRRTAREPVVTQQCTPLPLPPRQYRYIGDFTDLNHQHQPIIYDPHVRPNFRAQAGIPRPAYPNMNHYALVEDCPPRNYYPVSLATPTDTYDMDLQMEINSATYADTSHGGFSGDEFSDFHSFRYDSTHDISRVASGEGAAVLSTSDVEDSLKYMKPNSMDANDLEIETRRSIEGLKQDDSGDENVCEIHEGDIKCSTRRSSDIVGESLQVTSCSDDCNGVITPSCSIESLTDFNEEPEHIPLNIT